MAKKIFMIRLEPKQIKWLKAEAKRGDTTVAAMIRALVEASIGVMSK